MKDDEDAPCLPRSRVPASMEYSGCQLACLVLAVWVLGSASLLQQASADGAEVCLSGDELMFLQQLPGPELFAIGELVGVTAHQSSMAHWVGVEIEWESLIIESVRCSSQHDSILLLKAALAELGFSRPPHRADCSGRLDILKSQLASTGEHQCSPPHLMQAVRNNGFRSGTDKPFQIEGCRVKWYSPDEACRVLKDDVGDLQIVGDSLQRHFAQAVFTVLSGDYETTTSWMTERSDAAFRSCDCDAAYDDGHVVVGGVRNVYCRTKSVARIKTLHDARRHLQGFCPSWDRLHVTFIEDNYTDPFYHLGDDEDVVLQPVTVQEAGTLVIGGGLHFRRMDQRALHRVFNRPEFRNASRRVCMTLPAPGHNKPAQYLARQGLAPTLAFNQLVRDEACQGSSDFVLESFAITENASSVDGTHYYQEPNILLAHLLFNALDANGDL